MTPWAAAPGTATQSILQRGAHRLSEPWQNVLENGARFSLWAPRTHGLKDTAQQVSRKQTACTLFCRSSPISPVAQRQRSVHLRLCQAPLDDSGIHRCTCTTSCTTFTIEEVQNHDRSAQVTSLHAAGHKAGPHHPRGRDAMHLAHLTRDQLASQVKAASTREELHQDGEGYAAGPHASLPHLGEQPEAQLQISSLHATLQQRVVHNLVALEFTGLQFLRQSHCLVELTVTAVSLDERTERDEIWSHSGRGHLLQHLRSPMQVVGTNASIDEAVEDDDIAQHAFGDHFTVKSSSC
mmetsp:Transcript_86425/g.201040  ORF Transcript_86425/g.201040 Transcript_86425/m.201040 type:complete len:295 (-) Transcript_86425:1590-2474(-)